VRRGGSAVAGVLAFAAIWELLGRWHAFGATWPPLSAVLLYLGQPEHRAVLLAAVRQTGTEALVGLGAGTFAGIALASVATIVPLAAPGLTALAGIVNGIPIIAVAGVCVLTLPRDTTPSVVAALAAAFIVFVGAAAALRDSRAELRDLFSVLGASRPATFWRLDVPSALPSILDAVRSAAPASVVGAILGEWFAAERGLGPLLVASMQNYAITELWGVALIGAAFSMVLYALLGVFRAALLARLS